MQLFTTCHFLLSTASVFIFLHVVSWNTRAYSHFSQFLFSYSSCCSLGLVPLKRTCANKIGGWMPFLSPNQQCQSTENMTYFRFFLFHVSFKWWCNDVARTLLSRLLFAASRPASPWSSKRFLLCVALLRRDFVIGPMDASKPTSVSKHSVHRVLNSMTKNEM